MISVPSASVTTSDLRNPKVMAAAVERGIAVRDGKSGRSLLLIPQSTVDDVNAVLRYAELFVRVVVETQRADPSAAVLGEVGFVSGWAQEDRARFVRGFAESLATSLSTGDPNVVAAYLRAMSRPEVAVPDHIAGRFGDEETARLAHRFGS
jgi:hypothetical protein